ncbi:MAG: hypothetical protein ACRERS_06220, partial [Methylococcales bacterium]
MAKLIRLSLYSIFPNFVLVQLYFTWLSGLAYKGHVPPKRSPWKALSNSSLAALCGPLISLCAVQFDYWRLLPLGWLITLHGFRTWQLVIIHKAAHDNFI